MDSHSRSRRIRPELELLVRYSGVNQRAVIADEISTTPSLGFSGLPSAFAPHARGARWVWITG
jgi:hypothetical protein